ncbi:hypothetical protein [Halosimplex amylolyticum]|uniref:hypothetical protein n=1 Tax=Halosimplex amylolyticum TaxID=3396616 RepID=UPI003F542F41
MSDGKSENVEPSSRQTTTAKSDWSRRELLKGVGTGTALATASAVGLASPGAVDVSTASRITQRSFDPHWTSRNWNHWRNTDETVQGEEVEQGILINRHLFLNDVYQSDNDNMFTFHLHTLGACVDERDPEEFVGLEAAKSNHTFEVESNDIDVRDIGTTLPRIANTFSGPEDDETIPIEEVPSREDKWTTSKADLNSADISESDGDAAVLLGGGSIATGLAAGVPTLGVGTAATLTGTSFVLGLAGLYSGLGDYGEEVKATESMYRYNGKTKHKWGPGGIFTEVPSADVFTHHLAIDVPVKHGNSVEFTVRDKVKPTNLDDPGANWLSNGNHNSGSWTVTVPSYDQGEDPEEVGLPTVDPSARKL